MRAMVYRGPYKVRVEEKDECVVVSYTAKEIRRIPLAQLRNTGIM